MKKIMILAVLLVGILMSGMMGLIGYQAGKHEARETIVETGISDTELVREMAIEDLGEGDYVIEIMDDQGDGYIDYFVYEDGEVVMCGYTNREAELRHYYNIH